MEEWLQLAISRCLPKASLVHGAYYWGSCRNARLARWSGTEGRFYHWRQKFDYVYLEAINHPEDFNGFDFFSPKELIDPPPIDIPFAPQSVEKSHKGVKVQVQQGPKPHIWKAFMGWQEARVQRMIKEMRESEG